MDPTRLVGHRHDLNQTQAQMAQLLGCSLIGYKRFESGARPLPDYIAQAVKAFMFCHRHGLWEVLAQELIESAAVPPNPSQ